MTNYANMHDGRYPDDFRPLISETGYPPDIFVCPSSADEVARGTTIDEILKSFAEPHHCSYLYFGKGLTIEADGKTVLVTEPLENHRRRINVLHADKSVEWTGRRPNNCSPACGKPRRQRYRRRGREGMNPRFLPSTLNPPCKHVQARRALVMTESAIVRRAISIVQQTFFPAQGGSDPDRNA